MPMKSPVHPGKILKDCIEELGLSITEAAKHLQISRQALSNVINCHNRITAEMALRVSTVIGSSPEFWLNMQLNYDLAEARKNTDVSHLSPIEKVG